MLNEIKKAIASWFEFDAGYDKFELLETESGEPTFFGNLKRGAEEPPKKPQYVEKSLEKNTEKLNIDFHTDVNKDLIFREFLFCKIKKSLAVFINDMAEARAINDFILRESMGTDIDINAGDDIIAFAIKNVFTFSEVKVENVWNKVKQAILDGQTAVFIDGASEAIIFDTRGFPKRSVTTPDNEKTVLGPKQAFIENIRTNITLIRRIVRTDDLVCELRDAGGENNISAGIMYRDGITNTNLIKEVKRRMAKIDMRTVLSSGTVEQMIERSALFPLPLSLSTERPDRAANFIMQGHIVLLVDGSPLVHVIPITLPVLMAASEDAYASPAIGGIMRFVRYAGAIISILMPAIFIAIAMHHLGLLSNEALTTLLSSRKMVSAPIWVELIFLLLIFHLIREAGMRVPGSIGQAIGIIGGLILGQAAVAANLVSSVVLILIALTGLGNFCIPDYPTQLSAVYIRLYLIAFSMFGGLLGFFSGLLILIAIVASVKSFGIPYLAPFAPKTYSKRPFILRGILGNIKTAVDYTNTEDN
ncbi:MAG: spore germination protein [Clostridia bacterium]